MTENIKVSVLIPCYNVERYVEDALHCILSQSYRNLEIILIDDGSTDTTYDKLYKIAQTDKRIILKRNDVNLGLIKALNKGIELVTGKYIERFDADDLIGTNRIQKQMAILQLQPGIDLITSYATYITPKGKFHSRLSSFYCTRTQSAKFLALFETPLLHAGMLIKAELLKDIKYSETEQAQHVEDYVLFSQILFRDLSIYVDTDKNGMYFYRRNAASVSGRNRSLQFENAVNKSILNISTILNYNVPVELLRIIKLNEPQQWNGSLLNKAIAELKYIKEMYLTKEKNIMDIEDIIQIDTWVAQRRLRMLVIAIFKGRFLTKLSAFFVFLLNADLLIYSETYKSLYDKTIWIINRIRYNN